MSVSVLPGRSGGALLGSAGDGKSPSSPPLSTSSYPPTSTKETLNAPKAVVVAVEEPMINGGRRAVGQKRSYSSSESECLQSTSKANSVPNNFPSKKRNHKQRPNKKGRFNSPTETPLVQSNDGRQNVNSSNPTNKLSLADTHVNKSKALPRVPLTQQPKAPNNTTQFLITDREERESSDRDTTAEVQLNSSTGDFSQIRPRCFSSACHNATSLESSLLFNSSDSDEEQDDDSEFQQIYDNVSLERIQTLPREKVNREMLNREKCNAHLVDKVTHLKTENIRLKNLLQQNGIDFNKSATSTNANSFLIPTQSSSLNQSRSSYGSEGNSPTQPEQEVEERRSQSPLISNET